MSAADRYATLSEAWSGEDIDDLQAAREISSNSGKRDPYNYTKTSPTCGVDKSKRTGNSQWCDLYYDGYSSEIDSIMDMYTPGDQIPAEVRFQHSEWSRTQAPSKDTVGPSPHREAEAAVVKKTVRYRDVVDSEDGSHLHNISTAQRERLPQDGSVMPFGATAYDPGSVFAPFAAFEPLDSDVPMPSKAKASTKSVREAFAERRHHDASSMMRQKGRGRPDHEGHEEFREEGEDEEGDDDQDFYNYREPRKSAGNTTRRHGGSRPEKFRNTPRRGGATSRSNHDDDENRREVERFDEPEDEGAMKMERLLQRKGATSTKESFASGDDDYSISQTTPSRQYIEFAIYIISGVLLIFVMEQFVQIGLHMR